jgi:HSP20 family protein
MYRSLASNDLFSELNRLQRIAARVFDVSPSIRGITSNRFPALNVGTSPQAVEIDVYVPGVDPKNVEIKVEQNVLSVTGERTDIPSGDQSEQSTFHIGERFSGRFHRVVTLPDDVDANAITASYKDGVLKIKAPRREPAQPRRIAIQ